MLRREGQQKDANKNAQSLTTDRCHSLRQIYDYFTVCRCPIISSPYCQNKFDFSTFFFRKEPDSILPPSWKATWTHYQQNSHQSPFWLTLIGLPHMMIHALSEYAVMFASMVSAPPSSKNKKTALFAPLLTGTWLHSQHNETGRPSTLRPASSSEA